MADPEQKTPTAQRKPYHQNRPNYSNRGRGRGDPHVSTALHNFGVTDLREWLDKKHQQEEQSNKGGGPPPDPSYNYLKDPMRDSANKEDQTRKHQKEHPDKPSDSWSRGNYSRGSRGRRGGFNRDDRHSETEKTSYIQNPVNIKVELSTATGERSYKLDEETKLPDIKHVPDRKQQERRSFRGTYEGWRGRGHGGRGRGQGESGRGREETGRGRGEWTRGRGETGRGRGEGGRWRGEGARGRGDRGRGFRGRGGKGYGRSRGQGRYNPSQNKPQNLDPSVAQTVASVEIPTEENWDNECIDQTPALTDPAGKEEPRENFEEATAEDPEEYYEEAEEYEGDEYLELSEEGYDESEDATGVVLEENLVITSSIKETSEDSEKRTVRFKLDEGESSSQIEKNVTESLQDSIKNVENIVEADIKTEPAESGHKIEDREKTQSEAAEPAVKETVPEERNEEEVDK